MKPVLETDRLFVMLGPGGVRMDKTATTGMVASVRCDVKDGWMLDEPRLSTIDANTYVLSYRGAIAPEDAGALDAFADALGKAPSARVLLEATAHAEERDPDGPLPCPLLIRSISPTRMETNGCRAGEASGTHRDGIGYDRVSDAVSDEADGGAPFVLGSSN